VKQVRTTDLAKWKRDRRKIAMLTAYDAAMAVLLDRAGIDVLLVGDSLGMVVLGYETTIPVTLEAMIHHATAVTRGAKRPLVIADMPFLTYQASPEQALRNAGRLLQESGVHAVKMEGGRAIAGTMRRLVEAGIPVMGHIGLTPQSVHQLGGFRSVGGTGEEATHLLEDAQLLQDAGAFAIVLESMPADLAARITSELRIPTIGIGAGPECDGQVLVSNDVFGLFHGPVPRFVKQYANAGELIVTGAQAYIEDVRQGRFPAAEHSRRAPVSAEEIA
jgi:3-methyl-2-oxobutanoate hydroxymethyltransferase